LQKEKGRKRFIQEVLPSDSTNWFSFVLKRTNYHFPGMFLGSLTMGLVTGVFYILQIEYALFTIKVPLPFYSLLSVVVGLLLVFRTNTAYDRWWEGRKQMGVVVSSLRFLALKIDAFVPPSEGKLRKDFYNLLTVFPFVLKFHLKDNIYEEVRPYVDDNFMQELIEAPHKPLIVLSRLSKKIKYMLRQSIITEQELIILEDTVRDLTEAMSACERIKYTPIPLAYALHLKRILLVYLITLPFGFLDALGWVAIPVVIMIFYTMVGIETIGEEIEDPFGDDVNDLPMTEIVETMRKNIWYILKD